MGFCKIENLQKIEHSRKLPDLQYVDIEGMQTLFCKGH